MCPDTRDPDHWRSPKIANTTRAQNRAKAPAMTRPTPETLAHRSTPLRDRRRQAAHGNHAERQQPAERHQADRPAPAAQPAPVKITGAQSLVKSLEALGVEVVFGIPGGAILPAYDPLFDSKVRHILVRHEQGAGHAATGYAQATGKVGVCIATSGPGATNLVTPIADAYMDSVADRRDHRPGAPAVDRHRRLPGSRHPGHHAADHQAQLPGAAPPRRSRGSWPRRSTWPAPAAPGRCWSTSPRTCCRRRPRSAGRPRSTCPATGRRCTRTASRSARRPG